MGFSRQEYWSGLPFPSPVIKYEMSEVKSFICARFFVTPWTVAYQAPLSMGFFRQEYWSGLPFPSPLELHGARQNVPPAQTGVRYSVCLSL